MAVMKFSNKVFQKKLTLLVTSILLVIILLIIIISNCSSSENEINFNSNLDSQIELNNISQSNEEDSNNQIATQSDFALMDNQFPLKAYAPPGWNSPLIINGENGDRNLNFLLESEEIFISWSIINESTSNVKQVFFVDLLLDGIPIERWKFSGISPGESYSITDWSELAEKANLSNGIHQLSIVIDSTNLIDATNSLNKKFSIQFTLNKYQDVNVSKNTNPLEARFPNLEFFVPDGWRNPIKVNLEKDLPPDVLSTPIDTPGISVQFAYFNGGLTSVDEYYQVHVYVNDVFASKFSRWGSLPGEYVISTPIYNLISDLDLEYGKHELKVVLDPTLMVMESNESDNQITVEFIWSLDGIEIQQQNVSNDNEAPKGLTNVHGYKFNNWSASLILSNEPGVYDNDQLIHSKNPLFVTWALENNGYSETEFEVELFVDGKILKKWDRPSLPVGSIDMILDYSMDFIIDSGFHNVLLRVITASGEIINIYEDRFYWEKDYQPNFSRIESVNFLTNFGDYWTRHQGLNFPDDQITTEELITWMSVLYEEVHGEAIGENLLFHIVNPKEYYRWIESECRDKSRNLSPDIRVLYFDNCQQGEHSDGYYTNWHGYNRIVVKWDLRPIEFLTVISHELGHYYQSTKRNELDKTYDPEIIALKETQAYVHQSLLIKALEDKLGFELMTYPATRAYEQYVRNEIMSMKEKVETSHTHGKLLAWDLLLNDPGLRLQRTNLFNNLKLDLNNQKFMFDYLIELDIEESEVRSRLFISDLNTLTNTLELFAVSRLKNGLLNFEQGDPFLRETGLLIP